MSAHSINLELKLDILPDNKIQIPGCEPLTDVSNTLAQRWKCPHSLVDLKAALAAIPGARVEFGSNWGGNFRKRWLVLPPVPQTCCPSHPDWYEVLRRLEPPQEPVSERFESCDFLGQGYCPSPSPIAPPPLDPYQPEGATPFGVSVTLGPWVPPWQAGDRAVPNPQSYLTEPPNPGRERRGGGPDDL